MNTDDIIGTPVKIDNLEIAQHDFPEKMNWEEALDACINLGNGWRLPTKKELNLLYKNKELITNNIFSQFWCSQDQNDDFAWYIFFGSGKWTNCKRNVTCDVRAVKSH